MRLRPLLVMLLALTFLVAASAAYLLFLHKVERDYVDDQEHTLEVTGQTLALDLAPILASRALTPVAVRNVETTIHQIQVQTGTHVDIFTSDGSLHMDSRLTPSTATIESLRMRPEFATALAGHIGSSSRLTEETQRPLAIYVAVPIVVKQAQLGVVYVSHDTDQIARRIDRIRQPLSTAIVLLGVVVALLGLGLALNVRMMLERVRTSSSRMVAGNLGVRVDVGGRTEVADIAEHFNHMAASLQRKIRELEDERDKTKRFIQDITHELKTPLTGLSGSVHALQNGALEDATQGQLFVSNIGRDSERLAQLVSRLLEMQKLEYDAIKPVRFDMTSLVDKVASEFEADAARRNVSLQVEGAPVQVLADPDKIERVLENLVENAVRHSPEAGTVRIATRQEPHRVCIEVADQGPGIAAVDQPRVFERFYRGENSGTSGLGTAGLGLSIAREIVVRHDGEIGVDSVPGQGARFYFKLPC